MNQFAGHFFALIRATLAVFRAVAAMLHVMFATFLGATTANFRAMLADMHCFLGIARHQLGGHRANQRAIQVEFDTACEFLDHVLVQTGAGAVFTLRGAVVAGVNTALILFVWHNFSH
jgi:hypothetical protein